MTSEKSRHYQIRMLAALLFAVALSTAAVARAENWPQWRGAKLDGISHETDLPTNWSATEGVVWKVPLPGAAGATPVVWGDRIFLTSAKGKDLVLICINTAGKILWEKQLGSGDAPVRGDEGNSASPSPVTDGKHVWAMLGTGELGCFDFDGNEVWKYNLQDKYGKFNIAFGMTSTPVLDGDQLYLQLLHTNYFLLVRLDGPTGKEVWKHERTSDATDECEHSYASPIIYRDDKHAYFISHGCDYVTAHDLKDGHEVFRCGELNGTGRPYNKTLRFVASPVASEGLLVVPSAKNGPVLGLSLDAQGNITGSKDAHIWRRNENTPDVPSPLVHDGLVYLCRENGILICLDAKSGEEIYQETKEITRERHRASPVYGDGKIYLVARNGVTKVVKAGKKFELLASNDIGEAVSSSPVISGGRIYLRTYDSLFAIGKK